MLELGHRQVSVLLVIMVLAPVLMQNTLMLWCHF
jgi:hypothetical protein